MSGNSLTWYLVLFSNKIARSCAAGMRLCVALGLQSFHTIDVFHQVKCYGVSIRHQEGWSIV
jgi:ribonuclease Z